MRDFSISSLTLLLLATACSISTPVIDYTGLGCGPTDACGPGYSCNARGVCEASTSTSGTTGGSTGKASGGSSGASSSGSTSGGSSSGGTTTGGSSSGTTGSGGSSSGSGGLSPGLTTLALGRAHGCELSNQGAISCWGNNASGQLGDATLQSSWFPQGVAAFTGGATAIAAGGNQSCALYMGGAVICWGDQSAGSGVDNLSYAPTPGYEINSGATAVAVGYYHACAVATGGAVKCWGDNDDGQLGNGTFTSSTGPVTVTTFASGATAVAAGDFHSCALRGGSVSCWGNDPSGQLGNGGQLPGNPASTPVSVSNLTDAIALTAGSNHTCALVGGGAVQCWGANDSGQLGTALNPTGSSTPVPVSGLGSSGPAAVALAAGGDHTCALTSAGAVLCWGSNTYGELGSNPSTAGAAQVTGLASGAVAIAAGQHSSCAQLTGDGGVFCWGYGGEGELGGGSVGNSAIPQSLAALTAPPDGGSGPPPVVSLIGGVGNSLALTASGQALVWGENLDGQLGTGDLGTRLLPTPITALDAGVVSISISTDHGCAALTNGDVYCWGSNESGQLGNGSNVSSLDPVAVTGLPEASTSVACGGSHSCAVSGGALYCWGENGTGELGNNSLTPSELPVEVVGLDGGVAQVQANQGVTCALTVDGGLLCWGQNPSGLLGNGNGQVGNANGIPSTTPAQVTGLLSGVLSFSIGSNHGCAVTGAGAVECWGENFFGELGDGDAFGQGAPFPVSGLGSGFQAVTVGDHHSCALSTQGEVLCWGRGSYGEMGNGSSADKDYNEIAVAGLSGVSAIAAGDDHTCALTSSGIFCWGYNGNGAMGTGGLDNEPTPVKVQ